MIAALRLLAALLRKVPVSIVLLIADQAFAWLGKRRTTTDAPCNTRVSSSAEKTPSHEPRNDRRS